MYTSAIDELLSNIYRRLPNRSLRFWWKYTKSDSAQEAPAVSYPQEENYTQITECKKLFLQDRAGSSYAAEYPLPYHEGVKLEPYYPVLTQKSQDQHHQYRRLAVQILHLIL